MKYLPVVVLALLASTGCRSSRNQYEGYSPPGSYTTSEAYVPPAEESIGSPVNYGGAASVGASSSGSSCCQ